MGLADLLAPSLVGSSAGLSGSNLMNGGVRVLVGVFLCWFGFPALFWGCPLCFFELQEFEFRFFDILKN